MDIRHYTIVLDVDPNTKSINGYTEIDLNLQQSTNKFLFDVARTYDKTSLGKQQDGKV